MRRKDSPFSSDIDRVLCDLNSSFNPLHKEFMFNFKVVKVHDGNVYLSIVMPEGLTQIFVSLLENLTGLFRFIDRKTHYGEIRDRPVDVDQINAGEREQDKFRSTALSLFDQFIDQGQPVNEAVKRTNAALKAQNHPWATYDVVASTLRAAGRFRGKGKNKKP